MITCLFWPDEQYTYFKLHFMLYKKDEAPSEFLWGGNIIIFLHILSNITRSWKGQIPIILQDLNWYPGHADPDPANRSQFQAHVVFTFHWKFQYRMLSKIIKIMTHFPFMWKEIYFNLPLLWIKVKKFSPNFSKCVNLGKDPHLDRHYF